MLAGHPPLSLIAGDAVLIAARRMYNFVQYRSALPGSPSLANCHDVRANIHRASSVAAPASRPRTASSRVRQEADCEQLAADDELLAAERRVPTVFLPDNAATIIRENDSPDIPFRYSINPYRGCEHGCAYCYARPTHETLGMNAGIDFETKVLVKHDAVALLRKELNHRALAVRADHDVGRDRLLSAGGAAIQADARHPGGAARSPSARLHDHEELA